MTSSRGHGVAGAVVAGVLVLTACSGASDGSPAARTPTPLGPASSTPTPEPSGPVSWTACTQTANWDLAGPPAERRRDLDVRCGVLTVPGDHSRPGRGTLAVAVVRVRSRRQHDRLGSLVLNPGGPGSPGIDAMPAWAAWFPDELIERFDLVSFDPRGTGASGALDCGDAAAPSAVADVLTDEGFAAGQARSAAHSRACATAIAARRAGFGTDAVAQDLDLLRQALGDERLTYVGWSYGARLGAHYAHLYPDRVRALVLDAPPHPMASRPDVVDAQLDGFESTFAAYLRDCPARDSCALVAGDPRRVLDRVVRTARETPIPSGRPQGDPPATWDLVVRSVLAHLPSPQLWPALDAALSEADRGDSGSLYAMVDAIEGKTPDRPDADTDDAQHAILCTDTPEPTGIGALRAAAVETVRDHPTFGAYGAWWLFECSTWTAPRRPLPPPTSTTTAPVLVIGGEADPSTPFAGAQALVRLLGRSAVLLTSSTPGHTSFGRSGCVNGRVVRALVDAHLARQPVSCT
jgi:pimeloyl-ACP methyl ester carboxylesterase